MKKKKLLSLVLILAMMVTLILPAGPPAYAASDPGSTDTVTETVYSGDAGIQPAAVGAFALLGSASTSVNTWTGLKEAVNTAPTDGTETVIEITANLGADSKADIPNGANIVIQSGAGGPYTITRNTSFTNTIFEVNGGEKLTLNNVTLDGNGSSVTATAPMVFIYSSGEFTMDGATIRNVKGNVGFGKPAGILVQDNSTMTMKNGSVIDNVVNFSAFGAFYADGTLNMEDSSVINCNGTNCGGVALFGTLNMSGSSEITGNRGDFGGVMLSTNSIFNLSGAPDISGNIKTNGTTPCNVFFGISDRIINVVGPLSNTTPVGVTSYVAVTASTPKNITAADDHDWSGYFTSDASSYTITNSGIGSSQVVQLAASTTVDVYTWEDLVATVNTAPTDGTITNIAVRAELTATSGCIIDNYKNIVIQSSGGPFKIIRDSNYELAVFFLNNTGPYAPELVLKDITLDGNASNVTATFAMVYLSGGEFTMDSGTNIQNIRGDVNYGSSGVEVQAGGIMTMKNGAAISNVENINDIGYGALLVKATLNMADGSITGCKAAIGGAVDVGGTLNLSGEPEISGNTKTDGTPCNVFLEHGYVITINGTLTNTIPIGITTEDTPTASTPINITAARDQDWSSKFTSDDPSYLIQNSGSGSSQQVQLAVDTGIYTWADLADAVSAAPTDDTETVIEIMADLDADSEINIPNGANIVIQSAADGPYTATRNPAYTDVLLGSVDCGKLTLKNVTLDGNANNVTARLPMIYMWGGEFIMDTGAIIQNIKVDIAGNSAGVFADLDCIMTMKAGAVIRNVENTDYSSYGAVYINGTLNMEGGSITGCKAGYGAGVTVSNGSFNMSGGSVTDNTSDDSSVLVLGSSINLTGSPDISGNKKTDNTTDCNLVLGSGASISVGTLSNTTPIGITALDTPSAGTPVNITTESNQDWSSKFASDDPSYVIQNSGSGNSQVVQLAAIPSPFFAIVTVKKDSVAWISSTPAIQLSASSTELQSAVTGICIDGRYIFTGLAPAATYYVWDTSSNKYTGQSVTYTSSNVTVDFYTVTLSSTAGITSTNGSGTYLGGSDVTISATVTGGYNWSKWVLNSNGNLVSTTNAYTIAAISSAQSYKAVATVDNSPIIQTTSLPDGTVGTAYNQNLSAISLVPFTLGWSIASGSLPAGLGLNPITGAISGTPSTSGTFNFTVQATDSNGSSTKALSITINPGGTAPIITTVSLPNGEAGTAYNQMLAATGTAPITWSIAIGTLPIGLNIDSNTGEISGMPTVEGTSTFTVQASNISGSDIKILSITVANIPTPYTATVTVNKDGTAYSSGTPAIQLSTSSTALQSVATGICLNGVYDFTGLDPATIYYVWDTTNNIYTGRSVTSTSPSVTADYYTVTLSSAAGITSTNGSGTYLGGSDVPISATVTGGYNWSKWVLNSNGNLVSTTNAYTIAAISSAQSYKAVATVDNAPIIQTTSLPDGTVGTVYSQNLNAMSLAPLTLGWSVVSGYLPSGLGLNPSTGAISGTPSMSGTFNFAVQATDSNGSTTKALSITIVNPATYTLTITAGSGGKVSSAGGTYTAGASVSITATPNSNYSFHGWTATNGGSFANANSASTIFTMPANNTTITAAFSYNGDDRGSDGGSGDGTPAPTQGPPPTPASTPTHVPIIVDNNNYYIGDVAVENNTATITVDQSEFDKQLAAAKYSVVVPVSSDASTVVAQLVVKNVQDMNDKGIPLSIQTGNISYNIPASSIDTKAILSALGATDPSLAPVTVIIKTNVGSAAQALVNSAVEAAGAEIVVPALQFEIKASYNGKTCNIENFEHFVSRSVEITSEQAQQITTAVVIDHDGTIRHVPTFVYQKYGKWYAQINSLTNSNYALIFNRMSFSDAEGKWYRSVVEEMGSRKVINGVGNNDFSGDKAITRAEFAAIMVRALGLPAEGKATFSDVPPDSWYSSAVATAAKYGIVSGIGDNRFAPDAKITREQAMQMIYNASRLTTCAVMTGTDNAKNFIDYGTQAVWATNAVNFNINNGFIQGSAGHIDPKSNITRAETATVVLRLLQKSELVDVRTRL